MEVLVSHLGKADLQLRQFLPEGVWSLTQFYSVAFSQSRICVKKRVINKRALSRFASNVLGGVLGGTSAPNATFLTSSLFLCSSGSNAWGKSKALQGRRVSSQRLRRGSCLEEQKRKVSRCWGVIDLPSNLINDFSQEGNRNKLSLCPNLRVYWERCIVASSSSLVFRIPSNSLWRLAFFNSSSL